MAAESRTPQEERREVLHYAAAHSRADIVGRVLDEERKDPEGDVQALLAFQSGPERNTALHVACRVGSVDVVRLLLNKSAPSSLVNSVGKTPLDVLGEAPQASQLLVKAAFEAELFKLCAHGDTVGIEALVRAGLDLECQQNGYNPITWAELFDQYETANRLREIAEGMNLANSDLRDPIRQNGELEYNVDSAGGAEAPTSDVVAANNATVARFVLSPCPSVDLFPSLWPPVAQVARPHCHVNEVKDVVIDASFVELVFGAKENLIRVELPYQIQPPDAAHLLDTLHDSLHHAMYSAVVNAPFVLARRKAWLAPFSFELPALQPCLSVPLPELYCNANSAAGLSEDDTTENLHDEARTEDCTIDEVVPAVCLVIDPAFVQWRGCFQISLEQRCLRLIAHDLSGLRSAVQVLAQVFAHHSRIAPMDDHHTPAMPRMLRVRFPSAVLSDGPQRGSGASIFLDCRRLARETLRTALERLVHWRVTRVYVPVKLPIDYRDSAVFASEVYGLRGVCLCLGLELVPVLDVSSLLSHRGGAQRAKALQLLAQFQGSAAVALRFSCVPFALSARQTLEQLAESRKMVLAAGLSSTFPLHFEAWLPIAAGEGFLGEMACRMCFGSDALTMHPFSITMETHIPAPVEERSLTNALNGHQVDGSIYASGIVGASHDNRLIDMSAAFRPFIAAGLRVRVFAHAAKSVPAASVPTTILPVFMQRTVCEGDLLQRAIALGQLCLDVLRMGGDALITEVPVFQSPWCGVIRQGEGARNWCQTTAFLAAGISRDPAAALLSLSIRSAGGDDISDQLQSVHRRCDLLATHLLPQEVPSVASQNPTSEPAMPTLAPLARILWEAESFEGPPTLARHFAPLVETLLELLAGRMPASLLCAETRRTLGAANNICLARLTERKDQLQRFTTSDQLTAPSCGPARVLLAEAMLGVEWLRFASRLFALLSRVPADQISCDRSACLDDDWQQLRTALQLLPATKRSDLSNNFLRLVEQSAGLVPSDFVGGSPRIPKNFMVDQDASGIPLNNMEASQRRYAAEVLWIAGLRVGAALELEPWTTFAFAGIATPLAP